jgi:hypothetical protein
LRKGLKRGPLAWTFIYRFSGTGINPGWLHIRFSGAGCSAVKKKGRWDESGFAGRRVGYDKFLGPGTFLLAVDIENGHIPAACFCSIFHLEVEVAENPG